MNESNPTCDNCIHRQICHIKITHDGWLLTARARLTSQEFLPASQDAYKFLAEDCQNLLYCAVPLSPGMVVAPIEP